MNERKVLAGRPEFTKYQMESVWKNLTEGFNPVIKERRPTL